MKKNILYISPNFNLACGVSKNVYTLLTSQELQKEFNLHFITNGGDALSRIDKAGVNFTLFDFKTDKYFHFDLIRNLKQLRSYCKEKKIDIIHSHHRYPEFLSNRIKKTLGIRTIMTAHNFVTGLKSFSYKSDLIIAISNSVKKHLIDPFKVAEEKINVLYNCIEPDPTSDGDRIKRELNVLQNNFIIFYAGRIVSEKGIGILADSFKLLLKVNKNISLVIVGASNSLAEMNQFDLNGKNIFVFPAEENLADYFRVADVLILPSQIEGLGYTMLEAGLSKVSFIGSKNGGIAEFIEDGVNGYLFESGDAKDLAAKIKHVIDNPDEATHCAEKLHQKVITECNCEKYFEKIMQIYYKLLEK